MASKTMVRSTSDFERQVLKRLHTQNSRGARSCVDNDFGNCDLSTTINGSLGSRETQGSYIECLYFTFTTLRTTGFGDYLPQFKNNADYSLVLLALVGLAFVSSIFCLMNNVPAEQYGVSGRVVRSLREKNAKKSSEEKTVIKINNQLVTGTK